MSTQECQLMFMNIQHHKEKEKCQLLYFNLLSALEDPTPDNIKYYVENIQYMKLCEQFNNRRKPR